MQKITLRVDGQGEPRLDQAIAQSEVGRANGLSRTLVRKLLMAGAVYVNGKRVRVASRPMRGGETVDIYYDRTRAPIKPPPTDAEVPLRILYQDEALICFDKPPGLPTQPTLDEARLNLYELAKRQLALAHNGPVYLGMHHRLDRDTSGVVLFTREKRYNAFIAEQFRDHLCSKTYVAVVHGALDKREGRLESFLGEVARKGKQARFGSVKSGGRKAITDFLVLGTNGEHSLIEVRIETGRTHQIRVHLSELGHPIVGDTLYGSPVKEYNRLGRFLLHAHALGIEHPISHNLVRVESPVPQLFRI